MALDLQTLASAFNSSLIGSPTISPGRIVNFKIAPTSLKAEDIVSSDVNLTWIGKSVRFNNPNIESLFNANPFLPSAIDGILAGGMPVRVPQTGTSLFENLQGVPGQISQLRGTLPLVQVIAIKLEFTWRVYRQAIGGTLETTGFVIQPSSTTPEVSFLFEPPVSELTSGIPLGFDERYVEAEVILTAGGQSYTRTLPRIRLLLVPIAIPKVIVFFRHTNFSPKHGDDDGAAFILVPNNSPIRDLSQLNSILNTIESTISSLGSFANLAAFLLGISELINAIQAQPYVKFRITDSSNKYKNFNNVTLIQRSWYKNDIEAEDELSSLIFLGPQKSSCNCFNERNCNERKGYFTVTTGSTYLAIIKNLHSGSPSVSPQMDALISVHNSPDTFGDKISSIQFL